MNKMSGILKDKKAQFSAFNIYTFIIVAFLAVIIMAALVWVMGLLNTTMHNVGVADDATPHQNYTFACIDNASNTCSGTFHANLTQAADETFGVVNTSIQ